MHSKKPSRAEMMPRADRTTIVRMYLYHYRLPIRWGFLYLLVWAPVSGTVASLSCGWREQEAPRLEGRLFPSPGGRGWECLHSAILLVCPCARLKISVSKPSWQEPRRPARRDAAGQQHPEATCCLVPLREFVSNGRMCRGRFLCREATIVAGLRGYLVFCTSLSFSIFLLPSHGC